MRRAFPPIAVWMATLAFVCGTDFAAGQQDRLTFETRIQPILAKRCGKCHSAKARKGGLDLSTMSSLRKGGESGEPAVVPKSLESPLWTMVREGEMPPAGEPRLSAAEIDILKKWIVGGAVSRSGSEAQVTQHDILPFLYARCVVCHGRRQQKGGLDLRSVDSILRGGKSGPAVIPGKPHKSLLLKKVQAKDMPPPRELIRAGVRPLESSEVALISQWIAQGAKQYEIVPDVQTTDPDPLVSDADRQFWSFRSPTKPKPPTDARSPIDGFLLRKLKPKGLSFSPPAARLTLIRRVAFDLTGLPPKWSDVRRFLKDPSDQWYRKLVDFYLQSPHYGEHWGRYWLDLAGYADSEGKRSADPIRPHAWRYRDYVIRAFNNDKPYDRFLLEQIAGDELFDFRDKKHVSREMMDALVATGFLRMAPDGTGSDIVDTVEERFEVVADEIEILGSSVLGLTLKCAQCHTHKYDPIPQRDYYRLVAVFQPAYDVYDWLKPTSVPGQSKQKNISRRYRTQVTADLLADWERVRQGKQARIAAINRKLSAEKTRLRAAAIEQKLATVPIEIRADVKKMLATPARKRSVVQAYLATKFEKQLAISDRQLLKKHPALARLQKQTQARLQALKIESPDEPLIRALWDRGEPSPTWVFRRGVFSNPGRLVGPGVPSVLTDGKTPFVPTPQNGTTGRRLSFAKWLTGRQHPLTARVMVNRVWYHHFGRGIVESLANFGKTGTRPTHPELLDWLAVSFMENGWSVKWLHRQIMLSEAYRQSSRQTPLREKADPDNRWYSRMPLRRLSAESVRDALLAVAGQLDETRFGAPSQVTVRADGLVTSQKGPKGWRRTIYVRQRRKELPTLLETFDLPQMIPNCVRRTNSMVAPQALHLLNNAMVRELARSFAKRVEGLAGSDPAKQIDTIYQIALSRAPTKEERAVASATLQRLTKSWQAHLATSSSEKKPQLGAATLALANLCHVALNSAEFLFVD